MCICVRQRQKYFNFLLLSAILMALSPGNVYHALQNGHDVLPEVSSPPEATIFHSRSNLYINLSFSCCTNIKLGKWSPVRTICGALDETVLQYAQILPSSFDQLCCFSQLNHFFVVFVLLTPLLVSSLLQRWSPWLTRNTSYCLCTLRSILGKTGSGEKMTMITPDWPSKTFLQL